MEPFSGCEGECSFAVSGFPSDLGFVFITGLDATESFFSRYGASLKELDFSIMTFLWNEKYGHKLNSIEGKQLDYFCESASLKEARCLIWLLEEHRDKFPALHNALDEFFDIMGMWVEFQFILYLNLGGKCVFVEGSD